MDNEAFYEYMDELKFKENLGKCHSIKRRIELCQKYLTHHKIIPSSINTTDNFKYNDGEFGLLSASVNIEPPIDSSKADEVVEESKIEIIRALQKELSKFIKITTTYDLANRKILMRGEINVRKP